MPINFETVKINNIEVVDSKSATLTWSYDLDILKTIYKQLNMQQKDLDLKMGDFAMGSLISNKRVTAEEQAVLKHLHFELYLISKMSKSPTTNTNPNLRRLIKPFRTISAIRLLAEAAYKDHGIHRRFSRDTQDLFKFEYNLTSLTPYTKYTFELGARLFNLESFTTVPMSLITLRNLNRFFY